MRAGLAAEPDEDLSPAIVALVQAAAEFTARAFDAYAKGDWETCDSLIADARAACGEVFTWHVERIASPAWPYRVDSPFWEDFLARLAVAVLAPPAPVPPAPAAESEEAFLERLHQLVTHTEPPPRQESASLADEMRKWA